MDNKILVIPIVNPNLNSSKNENQTLDPVKVGIIFKVFVILISVPIPENCHDSAEKECQDTK